MRMRLMLLGGGNALGQALIRLGAEEDIGFLAPRPPEQGWDAASLTTLFSSGVDYVEGHFLSPAGPDLNYDFSAF